MEELSGDETLVLITSSIAALFFISVGWGMIVRVSSLNGSRLRRLPLVLTPAVGIALLVYVLRTWADRQVREHLIYQVLFVVLSVAWTGVVASAMRLLGIRIRLDAIERCNAASVAAAAGALLGQLLCYTGANIGGGETIWSTILPALLGTATWFALWSAMELVANISHAIAVERDLASGWRLAGVLIAMGLILGRAMAGDYHSPEETLHDFVKAGWPAGLVAIMGIVMQLAWRPTRRHIQPRRFLFGLLPCFLTIAASAVYIVTLGPWTKQ
jgi:hypothetical protein